MASCQIKDILNHVRGYHRSLRNQLESLSHWETDDRLQLLLNYMARHELNFEKALAAYEADAATGILNTWLKFVPDETIENALRHLVIADNTSVEEILATVLEFDKMLIDLYRELADETPIPRVQELFKHLLEMETSKDRQYTLSSLEFSD